MPHAHKVLVKSTKDDVKRAQSKENVEVGKRTLDHLVHSSVEIDDNVDCGHENLRGNQDNNFYLVR
jgi:hypothetical protein